jgi:hypothetical protein
MGYASFAEVRDCFENCGSSGDPVGKDSLCCAVSMFMWTRSGACAARAGECNALIRRLSLLVTVGESSDPLGH